MIKLAFFGAGKIVTDNHIPNLEEYSKRNGNCIEFSWAFDIDEGALKYINKFYKIRGYSSFDEIIPLLSSIDVIFISTPIGSRQQIYSEIARFQGLNIYLEKPFAWSYDHYLELKKKFKNKCVLTGLQKKTNESFELFERKLLDEDVKECSVNITSFNLRSGTLFSSDYALARGGVFMDVGIHYLDMILTLFNPNGFEIMKKDIAHSNKIDFHFSFVLKLISEKKEVLLKFKISQIENSGNYFEFLTSEKKITFWPEQKYLIEENLFNKEKVLNTMPINTSKETFIKYYDFMFKGILNKTKENFGDFNSKGLLIQIIDQLYKNQ
jgi:hypothetical protein